MNGWQTNGIVPVRSGLPLTVLTGRDNSLTGTGNDSLAVKAMKAGAADFLRKPGLAGERLARSVEDALIEQEARRAEVAGP